MPSAVTHGEMRRFLLKNKFVAVGNKHIRYIGVFNAKKCMIVFHYHKDKDILAKGTFGAIAKSLGCTSLRLYVLIK